MIKQNGGEGGLSWEPDIQTHNVATLHKKDTFDPEGDTESRWRVEQYDVRLTWALEPP
ncbi:hypothetical protein G7L61_23185, partial [Shigella sonnei]|nr:hypothetical protein [Shigella sonnei]